MGKIFRYTVTEINKKLSYRTDIARRRIVIQSYSMSSVVMPIDAAYDFLY